MKYELSTWIISLLIILFTIVGQKSTVDPFFIVLYEAIHYNCMFWEPWNLGKCRKSMEEWWHIKYVVSSLHCNIRCSTTVFNVFQDNPCIHNILCAYPSNSCGLIGLPYKLLLTQKEKYFCLISRKFYFLICFNVTTVGHKLQLCRMAAAITVLFNNTYDGTEIVLIFMGSDNVAH